MSDKDGYEVKAYTSIDLCKELQFSWITLHDIIVYGLISYPSLKLSDLGLLMEKVSIQTLFEV